VIRTPDLLRVKEALSEASYRDPADPVNEVMAQRFVAFLNRTGYQGSKKSQGVDL
jgi:hypothetical protein